jgi:hypothetical protein
MDEKEFFNRDSMFWREVNASLPHSNAEIQLNEGVLINGMASTSIKGLLLPFETAVVEYDMDNGGSFTKKEVSFWPFVSLSDIAFYEDESQSKEDRNSKVQTIAHELIQSIRLLDVSDNVILKKAKI